MPRLISNGLGVWGRTVRRVSIILAQTGFGSRQSGSERRQRSSRGLVVPLITVPGKAACKNSRGSCAAPSSAHLTGQDGWLLPQRHLERLQSTRKLNYKSGRECRAQGCYEKTVCRREVLQQVAEPQVAEPSGYRVPTVERANTVHTASPS